MIYEVIRPMQFVINSDARDTATIPAGARVQSLVFSQMSKSDAAACKNMAKRHRKENPHDRLVFFSWRDRPRGGVIGRDLRPARRRAQ